MNRFVNKVVGVTGAAQGIGAAIAFRFAREGAKVVLMDLKNEYDAVLACQKTGAEAIGLPVDVATKSSIDAAVGYIIERWGAIDIWINNAGIFDDTPLNELTEPRWDQIIDVNYKSAYLCAQAVTPHMIKQGWGRIINIASMAAKVAFPNETAYISSKAAVVGLTRALAAEFGPEKITVNAICPGPIETEMLRQTYQNLANQHGVTLDAWYARVLETIPAGRIGRPADVAGLAAYLASYDAGFINGQAINIDGGMVFY